MWQFWIRLAKIMAHVTSFWVVPVQLIPSFVKYQVIFAQTRNVLCCWYSWIPECGCIHNARHGPVLPFTNQIKAATGFPISEKLFPKLKDKQNSFHQNGLTEQIWRRLTWTRGDTWLESGSTVPPRCWKKYHIRYISGVQVIVYMIFMQLWNAYQFKFSQFSETQKNPSTSRGPSDKERGINQMWHNNQKDRYRFCQTLTTDD